MDNPYLKAQCQNMVSALAAFSTACELAAYEDDGSLSKEELRQLRRIHAAAAVSSGASARNGEAPCPNRQAPLRWMQVTEGR